MAVTLRSASAGLAPGGSRSYLGAGADPRWRG
jgi:hypothetical protein